MKKQLSVILGVIGLVFFGSNSVSAMPDSRQEITTAIQHAEYANKATNLVQVQAHLRHVINCLVGGQSDNAMSSVTGPCDGMGHGAINDFRGDKVNRDMLKQALLDAQYGLLTKRLKIAQNAADLAEKSLKKSEMKI
jgi:hypothetical protein